MPLRPVTTEQFGSVAGCVVCVSPKQTPRSVIDAGTPRLVTSALRVACTLFTPEAALKSTAGITLLSQTRVVSIQVVPVAQSVVNVSLVEYPLPPELLA